MKRLLLILSIFSTFACLGQEELYKLGLEPLQSEQQIRERIITNFESVPKGYIIKPIIKHRIIEGDHVVNIVELMGSRSNEEYDPSTVEFTFVQDPCYLNLNAELPGFKMNDSNFKTFSSSILKGKPLLLFFWAPQIPQCLEQFPFLNDIAEKYLGEINIVSMTHENCDISHFDDLQAYKNLKTHLIDHGSEYHDDLEIRGYPMYFFIDGNGIVREIQKFMPQTKDEESGKYGFNPLPFERIFEGMLSTDN